MGRRWAIFIWGGLGNTVMALPMINALRCRHPQDDFLIMLPRPQLSCLLLRPHDRVRIGSFSNRSIYRSLIEVFSFGPEIALASLPYPRWRYGLAAWLSGARTRIGDPEFPNRLLNVLSHPTPWTKHFVERNLALLAPLGIANPGVAFDIPIDQQESHRASEFLKDHGLSSFVAIHPGSGNPLRRWPLENYCRLAASLRAHRKEMLIVAGPEEVGLVNDLFEGLNFVLPSCTGPLPELLPILARASALVAVDSGLAHTAAALGVPTLALMGPDDERIYRPYGPHVRVLTNEVSCRPCYRPGGRIRCSQERRLCLDIGVDRVLAALKEMI